MHCLGALRQVNRAHDNFIMPAVNKISLGISHSVFLFVWIFPVLHENVIARIFVTYRETSYTGMQTSTCNAASDSKEFMQTRPSVTEKSRIMFCKPFISVCYLYKVLYYTGVQLGSLIVPPPFILFSARNSLL